MINEGSFLFTSCVCTIERAILQSISHVSKNFMLCHEWPASEGSETISQQREIRTKQNSSPSQKGRGKSRGDKEEE